MLRRQDIYGMACISHELPQLPWHRRGRDFIDHRCHCGKAHFSLALEEEPAPDDTTFEVAEIPFVAGPDTAPELPSVEIDFVETVWTKGFTIRNVSHQCGAHMMD